ncbi:AGE family epimerase/isomerase [bacterium]|nr:AGE family epimerase/isomerase [bacterium]
MDIMKFEFSDTIAGYVTYYERERGVFGLRTTDGREFQVTLSANVYARITRNLSDPWLDCTGQIGEFLEPGRYLFVYGTFYPEASGFAFEAQVLDFPGRKREQYQFEQPDWWIKQAMNIAQFFIKAQFSSEQTIDYRNYRTMISLSGLQTGSIRQETDTISRLVYGFASTYLLTGEDVFLEAAEKGTVYLRDHMRFYDLDENIVYWYHGIDVSQDNYEHKVFASEFGDDYDAIPMYEQIYALAGPTQTYRITGDPLIRKDIDMTLDLFERFFKDTVQRGYFSHIDPITLDARSEGLGRNRARKNWNSVGDHAPAYLINLWLATGLDKYKDFLEYTADCICAYFPDYEHSPFVQERFFEDWSHDKQWGWQQDRAVVGHNLKIAWNLMRINSLVPKPEYVDLARKIAEIMPEFGMDKQRAGWYDVLDRELKEGSQCYRYAWHDRKAWWQQEQAILAYQILYGVLHDQTYLRYARESASFYNTYFLDHLDGAVYFNVFANGLPYLLGTERYKGSHSMSGYHSIELAYLAQVYTNLLHTRQPLDLYFKPLPNGFSDKILRVQPDILPAGSCRIAEVWIDEKPWSEFDPEKMTVMLPDSEHRLTIKVRLVPTEV